MKWVKHSGRGHIDWMQAGLPVHSIKNDIRVKSIQTSICIYRMQGFMCLEKRTRYDVSDICGSKLVWRLVKCTVILYWLSNSFNCSL